MSDLAGIWLQPGFVEGIIADHRSFDSLETAFRHIFRRNLEYAILLWNGLPVRFGYPDDIPAMIDPLVSLLQAAQERDVSIGPSFLLKTPNIHALWKLKIRSQEITLEGNWLRVPGSYEAALNRLGPIRMPRRAFLCEWKLLLEQLINSISDAEAVLNRPEARRLRILKEIEAAIPARGRFYQYL